MIFETVVAGIFGLLFGSFLTVVAERVSLGQSFVTGRSHCNHCNKVLSWWELIPLIGYFLVHGECSHCHKKIPVAYNFFEILTALVFAGLVFVSIANISLLWLVADVVVSCLLLIIFISDWREQSFIIGLAYVVFGAIALISLARAFWAPTTLPVIGVADSFYRWLATPASPIVSVIVGGIVGAGALALLAVPSKGKWMGYGDVFIGGMIGMWLGYPFVIVGLVLAIYLGAIVGVILIISKRVTKDHTIAFGPFLIFGAIIAHLWAEPLAKLLLRILGGF